MKGLVNSPSALQFACSSGNCTWSEFSALGICSKCTDVTGESERFLYQTITFNLTGLDPSEYEFDGSPGDCETWKYITPSKQVIRMQVGCSFRFRANPYYCEKQSSSSSHSTESLGAVDESIVKVNSSAIASLAARMPIETSFTGPELTTGVVPTTPAISAINPRSASALSATTASLHNLGKTIPYRIGVLASEFYEPDLCSYTIRQLPTSVAGNATYPEYNATKPDGGILKFAIAQMSVTKKDITGRIAGEPNITECELRWCEKVFSDVKVVSGHQSHPREHLYANSIKVNGGLKPPHITNRPLDESQLKEKVGYWMSWAHIRNDTSDISIPKAWDYMVKELQFAPPADEDTGFGPAAVLTGSDGIHKVFDNIAEALTHEMYILEGHIEQTGKAYSQEVFIRVRWEWAIFPIILDLLGVIFLASNVWINSRDGVYLWKSSLLPLLFHGLEGWGHDALDFNEQSEMEKKAKKMYAKLKRSDMGSTKLVKT